VQLVQVQHFQVDSLQRLLVLERSEGERGVLGGIQWQIVSADRTEGEELRLLVDPNERWTVSTWFDVMPLLLSVSYVAYCNCIRKRMISSLRLLEEMTRMK
jgi:hypothetical protein